MYKNDANLLSLFIHYRKHSHRFADTFPVNVVQRCKQEPSLYSEDISFVSAILHCKWSVFWKAQPLLAVSTRRHWKLPKCVQSSLFTQESYAVH